MQKLFLPIIDQFTDGHSVRISQWTEEEGHASSEDNFCVLFRLMRYENDEVEED